RVDLAQYRELEAFSQFASDLDETTQRQLAKGERLVEILKQGENQPLRAGKQILIIFSANAGYLTDLDVDELAAYEKGLYDFAESKNPDIWGEIEGDPKFGKNVRSDDQSQVTADTLDILDEYTENFKAQRQSAAAE
ncbi:MAG: F0F1 ATP synthase subunit alpha, partial [Persicimonas sp.]